MIYVSRDENGVINGVFSVSQAGYAEEAMQLEDPEVIEFLGRE